MSYFVPFTQIPIDVHWSIFLSPISTFIIGVIAIHISNRQSRTAKSKLKLDLFDKRYAVYKVVSETLAKVVTEGKVTHEIHSDYLIGIAGAKFLYGEQMANFLDGELWKEMTTMLEADAFLAYLDAGEDRKKYEIDRRNAMGQLNRLWRTVDVTFYPYLHLSH